MSALRHNGQRTERLSPGTKVTRVPTLTIVTRRGFAPVDLHTGLSASVGSQVGAINARPAYFSYVPLVGGEILY